MYQEEKLFSKEWSARTSRLAFLRAVVLVFERFAAQDKKPSSTYWTTHHGFLRQHAMPEVLAEWAEITGLDSSMFPWTEDEVATTWEEWRKTNQQYREAFRQQIGLLPIA